jgi:hypothetical protein
MKQFTLGEDLRDGLYLLSDPSIDNLNAMRWTQAYPIYRRLRFFRFNIEAALS